MYTLLVFTQFHAWTRRPFTLFNHYAVLVESTRLHCNYCASQYEHY